jgi:hypothetical protein
MVSRSAVQPNHTAWCPRRHAAPFQLALWAFSTASASAHIVVCLRSLWIASQRLLSPSCLACSKSRCWSCSHRGLISAPAMSTVCLVALQQQGLPNRQHAAPSRAGRAPVSLPKCCWPHAGHWLCQNRHGAPERSRQMPRRGVACSSSSPPHLAFQSGGRSGSSGEGGSSSYTSSASGSRTLNDVIHWTINLPWQKAFSWVVVGIVASQLRDFFGVRRRTLRLLACLSWLPRTTLFWSTWALLVVPGVVGRCPSNQETAPQPVACCTNVPFNT